MLPMCAIAQVQEVYFSSFPCVSPDGSTIVFTYAGDLWKVGSAGGQALRITAMEGEETRARFSPDGKWIAFTGSQYGNHDVYVMPVGGGEIKQLTFHDDFDHVDNWAWDSQTIYFTSGRFGRYGACTVNRQGGTPVRLFDHYFSDAHNLAVHPSGELFFSETFESKGQAFRKGYKGAYNPNIQSWNPSTKQFKQYTDYLGKDMWPTIDRDGNIFFVSDESNNEYNLYTFKDGIKTALTSFPVSIRNPVVSANGGTVVFEKDYQLFKYDVSSGTSTRVSIQVASNHSIQKEKDFDVKGEITYFDVAADGKKLAFVSRGELFASDVKGKFVRLISTHPLGRVLEVKWMADNKTLLYSQTSPNGFTNWYSIAADGSVFEKQITSDAQNNRHISLNTDRTRGVYLSGRNEVRVIDLKTYQNLDVVREEIWGLFNSEPQISPNGEYILFVAKRNFEDDLFIYHLQKKVLTNLTNTGVTERLPYWSPDGKYIYFSADRLKPSYPFGLQDPHIFRLPLERFNSDFRSDSYSKLFEVKKEVDKIDETAKGKRKQPEPKQATPEIKNYSIDLTRILDRIEQVSPDFGSQEGSIVFENEGKTRVVYASNHGEGKKNLWLTTYESFEKTKTEKIEGGTTDEVFIVNADNKYYTLLGGNIHTLDMESKKVEEIDISFTFRRSMKEEFTQMFMEMWANVKENFYNEDFHGLNWEDKRDQYAEYVPHLQSRSDLRVLLRDLLGELNSSHTGFGSDGDEEKTYYTYSTLSTGLLFDNDDPYRVAHIIPNSAMDRKGISVTKGDILVKVDGEAVDPSTNRERYFARPSIDPEVTLTFSRGSATIDVKISPHTSDADNVAGYDEWVDTNEKFVEDKSDRRIAYAHMKNMGGEAFERFMVDMTSEAYHKEALIVDLRYNTGGNVHDKVLQFLSQRPYLQWKYREGALTSQPNFTPAGKPIVMLVNEQSLSDAEMTATGFKELGLGKIIGTETYRWIIFTAGKSLVDGSFYRLPAWGCYTLDGRNIEKEGVTPDIHVPLTFTDKVENKDPQLERAIEEIMKELNGK
jgi:tricorn protease